MVDIDVDMQPSQNTLSLLEGLVIDNPQLEKLEALLDEFNIFEALGAVRQEVRHSNFLAFLLDPQQNHGLDDLFSRRLLQKAVQQAQEVEIPVTPIDFDLWELDDLVVFREWRNIDIFLRSDNNRLAVVVENKVGSGEHSGQLKRYRHLVERQYPGWKIICLYLTPAGDQPSDTKYLPVDYNLILQLVELLCESRASTLGPDVRTLMLHYSQMLRRHIVNESEIVELCQRIYKKHKRALDLIYEHRPDVQSEIQRIVLEVISETLGLTAVMTRKSQVRLVPDTWLPLLAGEIPERPLLFFEFRNNPNWLRLSLIIGPGPVEPRQRLLDMALSNRQAGFWARTHSLNQSWNSIFARRLLTEDDYVDAGLDELEQKLREAWQRFLNTEFPAFISLVKNETWIWDSEQPVMERAWLAGASSRSDRLLTQEEAPDAGQ